MITFSTPPTEANQLSGIVNVLNILPDNTAKQISPKDVRDAVYTIWENTILKPTSASGSSNYIGIDQYQLKDSSDVATYPKMYFGKKQTGGQFIMNNDLLNSTTDFFFYNMKDNSTFGNYDTTIAILAGTGSFFNNGEVSAPALKSTVVSTPSGNYINLNILNRSFVTDGSTESGGDINIKSSRGYVSINDFIFPKADGYVGLNGQDKDGYVLKYRWILDKAYGVWESAFSQSITTINSTGQVSITGNPIVLNGYRFSDSNIVPTNIGGILAGETFSNVDVLDMLRRIIYTYVPPKISSYFTYNSSPISLLESGGFSNLNLNLNYSITINSTFSVTTFIVKTTPNDIPRQSLPPVNSILRGENTGLVGVQIENGIRLPGAAYDIHTFTFSVTDTYPSTRESASVVKVVLPYYFGTLATFSNTSAFLLPGLFASGLNLYLGTNSLAPANKLKPLIVEPIIGLPTYSNNQSLNITTKGLGAGEGQGYIYFGYPSSYPSLKAIIDYNGIEYIQDFTTYSVKISSPNNYWQSRDYTFYVNNSLTTVDYKPIPWNFMFITQSTP